MMMKNTVEKYFYRGGDQTDLRFFQSPKVLYYSNRYCNLSVPSKTLYCILLDRVELSLKNNWTDEDNRIFIHFRTKPALHDARTRAEKPPEDLSLTEIFNVDARTIKRYKEDLNKHNLLVESRSGQGKTNRLYLLKPVTEKTDHYEKKTPEQMLLSEDPKKPSMYMIYERLSQEFGSEALSKALAITEGQKMPVKSYYAYMRRIVERLVKEDTAKSHVFFQERPHSYLENAHL